jgi:poly-gamma-glutamate capsule biosynthesis protein CapA/YwtB (metallophosphatase superfamily)
MKPRPPAASRGARDSAAARRFSTPAAALAAAALAAAALATTAVLGSCSASGHSYELAADQWLKPELEKLVETHPLPAGRTRADSSQAADAVIELSAFSGGGLSADAGVRYLAAAVAIEDARYSVGPAEARAIGLRPLESILPPERALAVDGRWPGESGYPFVEALKLSARRAGPRGGTARLDEAMAAWLAKAAEALAASRAAPLRLAAAGDFQAKGREAVLARPGGVEVLLAGGLVDRLRSADLAVLNFEGVASARGEPNPRKRFRFRMQPGAGKALAGAGVDAVLLANNHVLDYGPDAFADTLSDMKAAGMAVLGAGPDEAAAAALAAIPAGGRLRLLGFATYPLESLGFKTSDAAAGPSSPGINADEALTIAAIESAKAAGDTVVILAHGGAEYLPSPSAELRSRYARFADAGAALILGGHPHVLQGVAARGESLIAYSLGNFLFTGLEEPELSVRSAILEFLMYEGAARGFRIHPVIVGMDHTGPDPDLAGAEARFSRLCAAVKAK